MTADGRRPRVQVASIALGIVAVAVVLWLARDALFGAGVGAIHNPTTLRDSLTVCDRTYRRGVDVAPVHAASADAPLVLVDTAWFAPCPPADASGNRPCSRVADSPCATVVYVRVGADEYVPYELVGGP
jgi:hypothetical protein